jgi:hypothetical protein
LPAGRARHAGNRDQTYRRVSIPGVGFVETWTDLTKVASSSSSPAGP